MKKFISIVAIALVLCCVVGGTLAWLRAETTPVVNTFTYGDINITLTETTTNYKMVPGSNIAKDPMVTVKANSEACYLFVKIEKSANYDTYLNGYAVAEGWTQLVDDNGDIVDGVFYRTVAANAADQDFYVLKGEGTGTLKNGFVTVNTNVNKAQMEALQVEGATLPTLTFTAYAVQSENITGGVYGAWTIANS